MNSVEERTGKIRLFLVLENRFVRDSLANLLQRKEGLEVLGRSSPGHTSAEAVAASGCDVLLIDFIDVDWLALARSRNTQRSRKVIAVGMDGNSERFLEAVRCGVIGYLLKDASVSEVVAAVHAAVLGEATCSPHLCAKLFQIVAQSPCDFQAKGQQRGTGLTARQNNLMRLVRIGRTNKEIANELHLSEFTVKNHISRILKQLHAGNRNEAAQRACGLVSIGRYSSDRPPGIRACGREKALLQP